MKAIAETLGVSRSNLIEHAAPIASLRMPRSCPSSAGWSMSGRPMAIAA